MKFLKHKFSKVGIESLRSARNTVSNSPKKKVSIECLRSVLYARSLAFENFCFFGQPCFSGRVSRRALPRWHGPSLDPKTYLNPEP